MSFKQVIAEISPWITPVITSLVTWFFARRKNKADVKKAMAEADETSIDVRIKEDKYETDKYNRLLNRVLESDKIIEQLSQQIQEMSKKLLLAMQENAEIRAELALYKTIS